MLIGGPAKKAKKKKPPSNATGLYYQSLGRSVERQANRQRTAAKQRTQAVRRTQTRAAQTGASSAGGGYGYARDVKAAESRQARRGYGGARDVHAAKRVAERQRMLRRGLRGFGGARDRTVRKQTRQALARALATERAYQTSTIDPAKTIGAKHRVFVPRGSIKSSLTPEQRKEQSLGEKKVIKRYVKAPALEALHQLQRTGYAVGGATRGIKEGESVGEIATRALRGAQLKGKKEYFSDVAFEDWKPKSTLGKIAKGTASVVADVGTDPLSLTGAGLVSKGGKVATKAAEQSAEHAYRAKVAAERAAGSSRRVAKARGSERRNEVYRDVYQRTLAKHGGENARRGVTVTFGGRGTRKAGRALRRRVLPKGVERAARRRKPVAPLVSATTYLGKARRGIKDIKRIPRTRITGKDIDRAARHVASELHGGVRPPSHLKEIEGGKVVREHRSVPHARRQREVDVEREARAEAERLARDSKARGNALWGQLDQRESIIVADAIEAGRLGKLKLKAERAAAAEISDPAKRAKEIGKIEREEARLRTIAKEIRDENRFLQRTEERHGPLAGRVGQRSRTREEVELSAAQSQQPRAARERVLREQHESYRKRRQAAQREERAMEARRQISPVPEEASEQLSKTYARIKDDQSGATLSDLKVGKFGDDRIAVSADITIKGKKIGRMSRFVEPGSGRVIKEITRIDPSWQRKGIATRLAQREELELASLGARSIETVPLGEAGEALTRRIGGFKPSENPLEPGRVRKELLESPLSQRQRLRQAKLTEELIGKERSYRAAIDKLVAQRARAEGKGTERKLLKRERLREQAKEYVPRATEDELAEIDQANLIERLAGPLAPKRSRVGREKVQPKSSKQRTYRKPLAELRKGTERERAHAERVEGNLRAQQVFRGVKGAQASGQALANRGIANAFGEPLRKYLPRNPSAAELQELKKQGKSVYYLQRGNLEQLDPVDDLNEIKRASLTAKERAASDIERIRYVREENLPASELPPMRGGRYVVLDDETVARVQKGSEGIVGENAAVMAWDAANRTFKSLALMTPQYLWRNFGGDMFNAWTEEGALRLIRNAGRGQVPLEALGKRERALAIRDPEKRRKKLREVEQGITWFNRVLPEKFRTIKLSPEVAREVAGPSSQRLYQAIKRGNPDLTKDQIQQQMEHMLTTGRVSPIAFAMLAEKNGVIRQGRFMELMQEGRNPIKGRGREPWNNTVKRVEDTHRLGTFMGGLQRGLTPRQAANRAVGIHFDYGALTPFEKGIARRLMPFYTFPSRNIPFQAKQFAQRPGKYATLEKIRQQFAAGQDLPEGWEDNLSVFEARQIPIPIKINGKVETVSLGSPFTDLNDVTALARGVTAPGRAFASGDAKRAAEIFNIPETAGRRVLELLGPYKAIGELLTNKSFFFREDIAPRGRTLTRAPNWAVVLANMPGMEGLKEKTHMQQAKGGPVMWDKRAEYAIRSVSPGIISAATDAADFIPGVNIGVQGENMRGRTPGQRLTGTLLGARRVTYDPEKARVYNLNDRIAKNNDQMSEIREAAKAAAEDQGRVPSEADYKTDPTYQTLLARNRRLRGRRRLLEAQQEGRVRGGSQGPSTPRTPSGTSLPQLRTPTSASGRKLPRLR